MYWMKKVFYALASLWLLTQLVDWFDLFLSFYFIYGESYLRFFQSPPPVMLYN